MTITTRPARWTSASINGPMRGFLTFAKWSTGFILLIMVFLAIFRTHG